MSLECGMAALRLEMPDRVPRTEYTAAEHHFPLIRKVTGLDVDENSSPEEKAAARRAFRKAWTYDFNLDVLIYGSEFGQYRTRMGHAVFSGTDFDSEQEQLFEDPEDALEFDAVELLGKRDHGELVRRFNEDYRMHQADLPDEVPMTGTYVTLMSGLIDLFGWDTMLGTCGIDPEGFGHVADRYAQWMQQYMDALADSEADYVLIHDDIVWTSGAFFHPEWYRKYIFPNYRRYFAPILEAGKTLIYISDGNYTEFIDDIARTGVHGFVLEPTTDMKYIAEKYGKTHAFIGNADTRVLLSGTPEEIRGEVRRCMDIGKSCPGFFLAVGNHITVNTPVENCLIYEEAYREMCRR